MFLFVFVLSATVFLQQIYFGRYVWLLLGTADHVGHTTRRNLWHKLEPSAMVHTFRRRFRWLQKNSTIRNCVTGFLFLFGRRCFSGGEYWKRKRKTVVDNWSHLCHLLDQMVHLRWRDLVYCYGVLFGFGIRSVLQRMEEKTTEEKIVFKVTRYCVKNVEICFIISL